MIVAIVIVTFLQSWNDLRDWCSIAGVRPGLVLHDSGHHTIVSLVQCRPVVSGGNPVEVTFLFNSNDLLSPL